MQAGLAIRKYYSVFQGSRKNFVFNDTYRNQRLPKANLWIINYCILEMKPAISLPEYFKSVKKWNLFYGKTTKKKDQKKPSSAAMSRTPELRRGRLTRCIEKHR